MLDPAQILDLANEGADALEGIDVGEHTEAVGIAWIALCEICALAWQAHVDEVRPL